MTWLQHSLRYTRGLRPGSAEHRAAIRRASHDWHAGKSESLPRRNPGLSKIILIGGAALVGFIIYRNSKQQQAAAQLAAQANVGRYQTTTIVSATGT